MALFNRSGREARAKMEEAAKHGINEPDFQEKLELRTGDAKFAKQYKTRGRLYDKINVSLRTMDIIIIVTSVLIIAAIIVGIVIGQ